MKFATKKKRAVKKAHAKKAAAKNARAKTAGKARVAAAREMLAGATISARDAVIATLVHFSPGLVEVKPDGTIVPSNLFQKSFNDNAVGVDDGDMRGFFAAVSTAINDARVSALIDAKLGDTRASANIGDIARLIQLWIDTPGMTA